MNCLFILEEGSAFQALQVDEVLENKNEVMRWHFRLGHPNFLHLKMLFPSLFKKNKASDFHCETCEYAKHRRVPFPIKNYTPSSPFSLIHSDI